MLVGICNMPATAVGSKKQLKGKRQTKEHKLTARPRGDDRLWKQTRQCVCLAAVDGDSIAEFAMMCLPADLAGLRACRCRGPVLPPPFQSDHPSASRSHRPFQCRYCPYSASQKGNLKTHVLCVHRMPFDNSQYPDRRFKRSRVDSEASGNFDDPAAVKAGSSAELTEEGGKAQEERN
ncbi:hypothetical protein J0S82_001654 [Galemys pyrenaicus]|uniref:C2H2-type domain-containing protein n=1 Tax=Galemys pyrenaicus TaxID=202257 RepID=A0A8J6DIV3_GALPY|nr:hypothetical protein J0S82_001654 [Galemys pyrenaicus]